MGEGRGEKGKTEKQDDGKRRAIFSVFLAAESALVASQATAMVLSTPGTSGSVAELDVVAVVRGSGRRFSDNE